MNGLIATPRCGIDGAYQAVESSICLLLDATALLATVLDSGIDDASVLGLVSSRKNQRGVGRSILHEIDMSALFQRDRPVENAGYLPGAYRYR